MSKRSRILGFGSAGLLIVAGAVCAAVVGGSTGATAAMALIGIGLVIVTSLVFLEVGLSEDHQRRRDLAQSRDPAPHQHDPDPREHDPDPRDHDHEHDRPGGPERPRKPAAAPRANRVGLPARRLQRLRGERRRLR